VFVGSKPLEARGPLGLARDYHLTGYLSIKALANSQQFGYLGPVLNLPDSSICSALIGLPASDSTCKSEDYLLNEVEK
jgi:hypothetical protein